MKTYKYIIIGAVALGMASCDTPFFDSSMPSAMSPADMFSSPALAEQAMAGVYEVFGEDRGYRNRLTCGYAGLNTDVEYNRKNTCDYARYQILPSNTDLSNAKGNDAWGYLNTIIERCNNIVDGINKYGYTNATHSDSLKYDYLLGEALFLRSFALLEMVKYWGDIPVNVTAYDGQSIESATQNKVDRNVAFEQIRKDLKVAAEKMEWSGAAQLAAARNDVRRPSRAAAYALLARADLMYAGKAIRPNSVTDRTGYSLTWNIQESDKRYEIYQEVMMACDTILRQSDEFAKFKSRGSYAEIFKDVCADKINYAQMEQIWVVPLADGARGQVMNFNCAKFSDKNAGNPERYTMGVLLHNKEYSNEVSSNFTMAMVPTLMFPDYGGFAADDERRDVTVMPYRWEVQNSVKAYYNQTEALKELTKSQLKQKCLMHVVNSDPTQWACGKYRIEWMSRDNNGSDDGIDFPVIRMSDVLLMMAEASIGSVDELGVGGVQMDEAPLYSGQECFDKVRERAGVATRPLTLEAIQEERKFEFAGEYIRKWDLMRWGILKDKMEEAHQYILDLSEDTRKIFTIYKLDPASTYLQGGAVDLEGATVYRSYLETEIVIAGTKGLPYVPSATIQFARKLVDTEYKMYDYANPESLNSRQYWPIFNTILGASGGTMVNNYGY